VFVCFGIIPLNISLSYYNTFEVLIFNFRFTFELWL
jgi:hypothetical protein